MTTPDHQPVSPTNHAYPMADDGLGTLHPLLEPMVGRKTVVVGSAPLPADLPRQYIDSHEVVIRINNNLRGCKTDPDRYGWRTDLVFHCLGNIRPYHHGRHPHPIIFGQNPRYKQKNLLEQPADAPILLPSFAFWDELSLRGFPRHPSTGIVALMYALRVLWCTRLSIVGFDFYRSGYDRALTGIDPKRVIKKARHAHRPDQDLAALYRLYQAGRIPLIYPDKLEPPAGSTLLDKSGGS